LTTHPGCAERAGIIRDLRALVSALDERTPQAARHDEPRIALESAALRSQALQRLADLQATEQRKAPPPRAGVEIGRPVP
jgi:hypothetical protein